MKADIKQLGLVATLCFFPSALLGWPMIKTSEKRAIFFFRLSIYLFLLLTLIAGTTVVISGVRLIEPMGSFF